MSFMHYLGPDRCAGACRRPRVRRVRQRLIWAPAVNYSLINQAVQTALQCGFDGPWMSRYGTSRFVGKRFVTRTRSSSAPVTRAAGPQARLATQFREFQIYTRIAMRQLQRAARAPLSWRRRHWDAAGIACAVVFVAGATVPTGANATHQQSDASLMTLELPVPVLDTDPLGDEDRAAARADDDWTVVTVRSGQTVADIFQKNGVNPTLLQRLLDSVFFCSYCGSGL